MRRNLHWFLENIESRTENQHYKQKKKLFWKCGLWFCKIRINMSIILVFLSLRNYIFSFFIFMFFELFFKVILYANLAIFYQSVTTIAKQFFLNFNYSFIFLMWYCLKTNVNRITNCVTQKFTPMSSKLYKKKLIAFYGQFS